jgi:hypothetical protein
MYRLENPIGALFFRLRFGKKSAHLARPAEVACVAVTSLWWSPFISSKMRRRKVP